jgi:hypothetical protein
MLRSLLITTAALAALALPLVAQTLAPPADTSDPRIVVLLPNDVAIDKGLKKEMEKFIAAERRLIQENVGSMRMLRDSISANPASFRAKGLRAEDIDSSLAMFPPDPGRIDFGALTSMAVASFLNSLILDRYRHGAVAISYAPVSLDSAGLGTVAAAYRASYLVALPSLKLLRKKGKLQATLRLAIFEAGKPQAMADTTLTVAADDLPAGAGCNEGTVQCVMNAGTRPAAAYAAAQIKSHLPKNLYGAQLKGARAKVLQERYLAQAVPLRIRNVLPIDSTMPMLSAAYSWLVNRDTTQFVVLFAGAGKHTAYEPEESRSGSGKKGLGDFSDLDDAANTYAFALTAASVNGHWYFAKQDFTYFDTESVEEARKEFLLGLQRYELFLPDGTEPVNPAFWSTGLFAHVEDPATTRELAPADPAARRKLKRESAHVGMIRFVADQIGDEQRRE